MKKILITGADSYIGTSVEKWLGKDPEKYQVDTVDMRTDSWKEKDFSPYDVVFHVAGIAHVSTDSKQEDLYFRVNRNLAVETAEKAKKDGVRQFIFMSSIIVYGDSTAGQSIIDQNTAPSPGNFYGDSKLQAEKGLRALQGDSFRVVILRPPMIYGKGSKGNYPKLAKAAQRLPIFPDFDNQRSMLHIDNLCEFIRLMVENEESGLFFPQNREYVKTSEMVRLVAEAHGKKIKLVKAFNPIIRGMLGRVGIVKKVFGNLVYQKTMSEYKEEYRVRDFYDSVNETER
ncbi:NAD-dependent epimerase/dehydratase family protein [Eubacteriales bacterium mix99]